MRKNEKAKNKEKSIITLPILLILITLILLFIIGSIIGVYYTSEKKALIEKYLDDINTSYKLAEGYYNKATIAYEISDFKSSEDNCILARTYYSDSTQSSRNLKAELESLNTEDELIGSYILLLEKDIKSKEFMYEACEYLETASRAYRRGDKIFGDISIEMMNEKIRSHDNMIREYNDEVGRFISIAN